MISGTRESGVEAGGAWRFRPQDAAFTNRTAAKYPSDGGFHPRRPTPKVAHSRRGFGGMKSRRYFGKMPAVTEDGCCGEK